MIRIKDYIFNENAIKVIENDEDLLTIIFKDGSYRETQGTFDDIEWNYEQSNIKEDEYIELSNKYQRLLNRNEELEESLDEQHSTSALLARKMIKTITLTEELYKMAKEQDSDNVNLIDRLENILKTLKGE
jgi:hypothetical protein